MNMLTSLNLTDFIIIGVVILSLLISLARGFIREALSLLTWIAAILFAFRFSGAVSDMMAGMIGSQGTRSVVAFVGLFIVILIIGGILNHIISSLISGSLLKGFDRILGVFFGIARGLLVIGLFVLFAGQTGFAKADWWKKSQLIPQFAPVTQVIKELFPEQIAKFNSSMKSKDEVKK